MSQVRGSNRTPIHTGCRAEEINMSNNNDSITTYIYIYIYIYIYTCYIGYQVSLVVSGSSSRSDDRGSNPAPTSREHLRSRVR